MKQIKCTEKEYCPSFAASSCEKCSRSRQIEEYEREIKRLKAEVERYKDEADLEHNSAMDWFDIAYQYKYDNDVLRAKLDKALELPYMERETSASGTDDTILYYMENGKVQRECFNNKFPEQLEARLKEIKEKNNG